MITVKEKAKIIYDALDEKKGEDIKIIDISKVSSIGEYFIIAGASNKSQVQAMADSVEEMLKKENISPDHLEGYGTASWVLMDYSDIIVHIFDHENRNIYDLERLWRDGKTINNEEL